MKFPCCKCVIALDRFVHTTQYSLWLCSTDTDAVLIRMQYIAPVSWSFRDLQDGAFLVFYSTAIYFTHQFIILQLQKCFILFYCDISLYAGNMFNSFLLNKGLFTSWKDASSMERGLTGFLFYISFTEQMC